MLKTAFLIIALLLSQTLVAQAISNQSEYAEVTAYVNGQKVPPIYKNRLKVGEPFDVEVAIELKKDASFGIGLSSPGKTQPFVAESGPGGFDETFHVSPSGYRKAGEKFDFKWRLKPTDAWTGGSAPITLDASFTPPGKSIGDTVTFTVASIYIEPPGGAAPPQPAGTPRQPGLDLASALTALVGLGALGASVRRR